MAKRFAPADAASGIDHGVPLFLTQLVDTLQAEQTTSARNGDTEATPTPAPTAIDRAAALHGVELLRRGAPCEVVALAFLNPAWRVKSPQRSKGKK